MSRETCAKPAAPVELLSAKLAKLELLSDGSGADAGSTADATTADFAALRDVLCKTAEQLELEANKFAVGLRSMRSKAESESLCSAFLAPCEGLASAGFVAARCGTCAALRDTVQGSVSRVCAAARHLVEGMVANPNDHEEAARRTGVLWERCKEVRSLPKSNRAAAKRSVMSSLALVKDTSEELHEVLEENRSLDEAAKDSEDAAAEAATDAEGDYFELDTRLSDVEQRRGAAAVACIDAALNVLRCLTNAVSTAAEPSKGAVVSRTDYSSWLDSIVDGAASMSDHATELGAALYPPQDTVEVLREAEALGKVALQAGASALAWSGEHASHRCWERLPSARDELGAALEALRAAREPN